MADQLYNVQLATYCEDLAYYAGAMARYLGPRGYDVMEVYTDVEPLQRAWARENGVRWNPATWLQSIPLEQAKRFKPDIVYSYDSRNLDYAFLREMRQSCPSIRFVTGFICSPSFDIPTLAEYDVVLTCTREYRDRFVKAGLQTQLMGHVFDPYVLERTVAYGETHHDIVFSGALWRSGSGHQRRERVLEAIANLPSVEMYSPQGSLTLAGDMTETLLRRGVYLTQRALALVGVQQDRRRRIPLIGKAATWTEMPMRQINKRLRPHMRPPVFGREMFQLLRDSKVTLNCTAVREAANMRLFEATGVGSCLLTDSRENLPEIFDVDREIVSYDSPEDCLEKARWLLDHPRERMEIAAAGQRRTLRDYTFAHRAEFLDHLFRDSLVKRS